MIPDGAADRVRRQLDELPKYLLWRLVEAFQEYRPGYGADDQYVKLSDVLKLFEGVAASPVPGSQQEKKYGTD